MSSKNFTLSTSYYKILHTLSLFYNDKIYPSKELVCKVLRGVDDESSCPFNNYDTFSTLVSYCNKKISRMIQMLVRYNFVKRIYSKAENEFYLMPSDLGLNALFDYFKKHRQKWIKKKQKMKKLYVHLDEI